MTDKKTKVLRKLSGYPLHETYEKKSELIKAGLYLEELYKDPDEYVRAKVAMQSTHYADLLENDTSHIVQSARVERAITNSIYKARKFEYERIYGKRRT